VSCSQGFKELFVRFSESIINLVPRCPQSVSIITLVCRLLI
jgi:hypothetical protein